MQKHAICIYMLFAAWCLALFPLPAAARTSPPVFQPARCPFRVPKDVVVECGYLSVPEDRTIEGGPQIQLAVAIARTGREPKHPDPVLYLSGGPGSAALSSTVTFARGWPEFLAHRDLIVVDQRGTGFSQPSLACPEHDRAANALLTDPRGPAERAIVEHSALVRCRDRLVQAGVKLGAYTNAANAQDLRDLREALGYAQWNVFGISYGTRLALSAARYDPQGIRSMILDSVYPPQANLFTSMPSSLDQALQTLYKGCAASPACQRAYPDLQGTFERLVARLDAQPVTIRLRDPRSGKRIAMVIDGSRMTEVVFRSLYRSELLPQLPKVIAATAKGVYGPLAELEAQRLKRMQGHSPAMYYAVECSTDLGGTTFEERSAAAAGFPQLASYFAGLQEFTPMSAGICDAWGIGPEQMEAPTALQSDIPTLLLAGEYDPITPASWAQLAAETLSRSEVYIFPGTGHAAITRGGCPRRMMAAFLDHFSAAEAGVCHSQFGGPAFAIK